MRTPTTVSRALVALVPLLAAGCMLSRAPSAPRTAAKPDSTRAARPASDSNAKPADTTRAPVTPKRATDSVARHDSAAALADSATKSDAAKKTGRKAPAPTKECLLDFSDSPPDNRLRYQRLPDSTSLTFIGGGFVGHCQGEKNQIRADSAEQYQASGVVNLFGNVVYEEPDKTRIEAAHATYFTKEQRLFADGNVVATQLKSGSTFRGPRIEYLRPIPGSRPTSRLIAPERPVAQIIEKDSTGKPGPPVTVTANTMVDEGDSVVFAWGNVQINRAALLGESDSASFDKLTEKARLIRSARIVNRDKEEPFRLFGDTIDIFSTQRKVERVVARHTANAANNDVVMSAETVDLRFDDQKLSRAFAFGAGRAKATTSTQVLEADSIAVRMPEQRVRQFKAVGRAVATGLPDTTKIKSDDRDILRGDTVTAWFDSSAAAIADTTQRTKIKEIHAVGAASSLFQIASKEGPKSPPALNYVRGKMIFVVFDSGQVRFVTVDSAATGMYLEPAADSLSDSTKRPGAKGDAKGAKGKATPPPGKPKPPLEHPIDFALVQTSPRRRS